MLKKIPFSFLLILFCFLSFLIRSQNAPQPIARFSFNDKMDYDEVNKHKVKMVGATPAEDRFGNPDNAVFISGNPDSYINLGTYKELKPVTGSISIWVRIESPIWGGKGVKVNPILLTKWTKEDDFYESYSFYYELVNHKFAAALSKDSICQTNLFSQKEVIPGKWHHLLLSFDNKQSSLYVDGELQSRFNKSFELSFLSEDSVLVGSTGNKKNVRFLKADVDDIEFYDRVLTDEEIKAVYNAPDPNKNKVFIYWLIVSLCITCILLLLYFLIRYQIRKGIRKEREKLELHSKVLETELRVNRASMNPHFIFNSLNALHELILNNEVENASDYLIKFSTLIRKILDSNMHESLPLDLEIELLERYLEIENLRFKENIKYTIAVKDPLIPSAVHIPTMMLQPFVENAIWQGLQAKAGEKLISIDFALYEEKYIYCRIEDNGKSRVKNETPFFENRSRATGFIVQRLELMNKMYNMNCSLLIEDKADNQGTVVSIILPILK